MERDGLGAVGVCSNQTRKQDVERAAEENIVCWGADDMNLKVGGDGTEADLNVACEAEGEV